VACLFNAGDYDSRFVSQLLKYCSAIFLTLTSRLRPLAITLTTIFPSPNIEKREKLEEYRDKIFNKILSEVNDDGSDAS